MNYTRIKITDPTYPQQLRQLNDAPAELFVWGNIAALQAPQLAMVGCRQMTAYGAEQAFQFAKALAELGLVITSGLAIGIDTMAHQGALAGKGQTIAVLGTGLNKLYPTQNKKLAEEIVAQGGAVISEFPMDMAAFPYNFPKRNRIISGLSLGVLVIEAAEKSGSLITARLALEQNREVFALPGQINSPQSRGCNRLIKEGATLVQSIPDLLIEVQDKLKRLVAIGSLNRGAVTQMALGLHPATTEFAPTPNAVGNTNLQSPPKHDNAIKKDENSLLTQFTDKPISIDALSVKTGLPLQRLNAELLTLELSSVIRLVPGGYILN